MIGVPMSARVFLTGIGLLLLASPADAQNAEPAPVATAAWSDSTRSLAICLGNPNWFVTVIPTGVNLGELAAPTLITEGARHASRNLHVDSHRRICLLETKKTIDSQTPLPLAGSPVPKAGERLRCMHGTRACETTVAGKDRLYRGEPLSHPMLRVRVADVEAFCRPGAPLVNDEGEIEGILTDRKLATAGEAHAIPAAQLRKLIREVKRYDRSGPVWVGLVFHNESSTPEVIQVRADSPADEAGIRAGDVVIALNQTEIEDLDDLVEAIHSLPAGEKAEVAVLRGLEERTLSLVPRFAASATAAR